MNTNNKNTPNHNVLNSFKALLSARDSARLLAGWLALGDWLVLLDALGVAGLLTGWLALLGLLGDWDGDGELDTGGLGDWGLLAGWLALSIALRSALCWGLLGLASLVAGSLAGVALGDGSSGLVLRLGLIAVWLVGRGGGLGVLVGWDGSWLLVVVVDLVVSALLLVVVLLVVVGSGGAGWLAGLIA